MCVLQPYPTNHVTTLVFTIFQQSTAPTYSHMFDYIGGTSYEEKMQSLIIRHMHRIVPKKMQHYVNPHSI